jgi:hypothetical protein
MGQKMKSVINRLPFCHNYQPHAQGHIDNDVKNLLALNGSYSLSITLHNSATVVGFTGYLAMYPIRIAYRSSNSSWSGELQ